MVSSVEVVKLLCRLGLMSGLGRKHSAVEMAGEGEDLQTEEILTPEDSRYLRNPCLNVACDLPILHVITI
jgi:hypothetical protein